LSGNSIGFFGMLSKMLKVIDIAYFFEVQMQQTFGMNQN
jgi:hypothetical protein